MSTKRTPKGRQKRRGSREHGWGKIGQHRKGGQRGGKGIHTGGQKHGWSYTVKYEPNYYGKKGFKLPQYYQDKLTTINVEDLEKIALEKQLTELNLPELGYEKVLGRGKISKPLKITAKKFTKVAIKKIEDAGGQCIKPN